jgi:hypothetical protein
MNTELSKGLSDEQWDAFEGVCIANGIPMDDSALVYGSPFLTAKYWFVIGWEASAALPE